MKLALFSTLAASAAAFAPASTTRQSSVLSASFENELGAQAPVSTTNNKSTMHHRNAVTDVVRLCDCATD
jgi:hypothetical protein